MTGCREPQALLEAALPGQPAIAIGPRELHNPELVAPEPCGRCLEIVHVRLDIDGQERTAQVVVEQSEKRRTDGRHNASSREGRRRGQPCPPRSPASCQTRRPQGMRTPARARSCSRTAAAGGRCRHGHQPARTPSRPTRSSIRSCLDGPSTDRASGHRTWVTLLSGQLIVTGVVITRSSPNNARRPTSSSCGPQDDVGGRSTDHDSPRTQVPRPAHRCVR